MKYLWSPWRMEYIQDHTRDSACVFCEAWAGGEDERTLLLHRGQSAFVILNRFPYTSGHLMVVPVVHLPTLEEVPLPTLTEVMALTQTALKALRQVYRPQAFNVGANIGELAGAGIADHVHLHVVPRWAGDTNFMATLAETRVLPEALDETYHRLHAAWPEPNAP
ncbi:MAG: HIT family hydrolase [Chloroflexi bacterium RBG_16_64_43]|nr:MAG: HIT family hydrolase [Chloroflexi bacterium RBG_16_64_43]